MDAGGFSVRAILTEIFILSAQESGVTDSLDTNNDGIISADQTLSGFRSIGNVFDPIKPHDYTVLITGYDLRRTSGNDVVGITYEKGACSSSKQGVMEEMGDENMAFTLAHEIGHTLAAVHDQQRNSCPDSFFVMSAASAVPDIRSRANNPWTFSACSGSEIRTFVFSQFLNCLRTRATTVGSEVNIAALTTVTLGQQYNADQQCRNAYGNGSVFCRDQYNDPVSFNFNDMCYNLRCLIPGTSLCATTLAFLGTSCGDKKWCVEGTCVSSAEAPARASATCPQLDDPTANCSPSSCQIEQLRRFQCCATCASPPVPVTLSIHGAQPATTVQPTTPGGGGGGISVYGVTPGPTIGPTQAGISVQGVQPNTTPKPPSPTLSIHGAQPQTQTPRPLTGVTMSIHGIAPGPTGRPPVAPTLSIHGAANPPTGPPGATLSIQGVVPPGPTQTPGPAGATLSIQGVVPPGPTQTPGPAGPTLSIQGVVPPGPTQTPGPAGPTLSIQGAVPPGPTQTPVPAGPTLSIQGAVPPGPTQTPVPVGPTLSIAGAVPPGPTQTPVPIGPTLSIAGAGPPQGTTLSIGGGQAPPATGTTMSVPQAFNVAGMSRKRRSPKGRSLAGSVYGARVLRSLAGSADGARMRVNFFAGDRKRRNLVRLADL